MVDAEDLKSFGHCDRVGSSPTIPTKLFGCVAQLVRALRSHRRGRWFESNLIHQILAVLHVVCRYQNSIINTLSTYFGNKTPGRGGTVCAECDKGVLSYAKI